jgi:hypothetical protein
MSQWFANEIMKIAFNRDTYTPGWNQFEVCALQAEPPSESDPTLLAEPTADPAYTRPKIPFVTASWVFTNLGEVAQANMITFPQATVDWGSIPNYALVASSYTGGFTAQIAVIGYIPQQPAIGIGDILRVTAQSLMFGLYDGH